MSIKSCALIGILLFLGAVGLAYFLQVETGGQVYSKRLPASDDAQIHLRALKDRSLKMHQGVDLTHTEKLRGPVTLEFVGPKDSAQSAADGFVNLKLVIHPESDLSNIRVVWVVPEGVKMTSGSEEEFVSLQKDEAYTVEASFQLLTGDNRQIHAQVSGAFHGAQFGAVAQYNTVFQTLLNDNGAKKKEALQKMEGETVTNLKVFQ
jgi:hypothetical protein